MAVKISGVLKDGTGKPVQNCTIQLKAKRNSTTVVVNTLASENPDEAGRYSMDVEYGQYSVILLVEGFPPSHAGTITVYEDSRPGTLNDFLGAMTEDDARPEALRRFELMVEEVARNASAVAQNTAAAKKSASDAGTSAREAATHATDAAGSARAASTSAGQAATSAQEASSSAGTASTKATEASKSAAAAESSKSAAATSAGAAKTSETNAAASQKSAATSASTATTKASEAATSARDAAASKEAAKSSETSAASSASNAASSATAAGNSAKAAKTSETNARSSETAAGQSASAAAGSKTAAASSASAASTSAGQASASATAAGKSAESAASSASTATTKAGEATEQASAAARSASAAKTSETNAKASETRAESSKTAAASSASSAASSASSASASKDEATRQASAAKGSATTASTKATEAAGSATAASQSKTAAESAATRAEAAADRAEEIAGAVAMEDASLTTKGVVKLSSAVDSTSESLAATPKAVKAANDNANSRLAKNQNGADIPNKDKFTQTIGACRSFHGSISTGAGNWTTAQFIEWLESQWAFNHPYWMCKCSWSYGNNKIITDTGCGLIHLAGCVIEVMGHKGAMTIRVTTPSTSTGGGTTNAQFTYINHGAYYAPGWRRDYSTKYKPTPSDIGALSTSGGTVSGPLSVTGGITGTLNGNASTATKLQTARSIGGVGFDGSANINLPGVNTTGNQNTTGNAATATKLQTARTIGGVSFDGTANINLPGVNTTGNQNTTGNAATATKLQTARTINGVSFDGSANISLSPANIGCPASPTGWLTTGSNGGAITTAQLVTLLQNNGAFNTKSWIARCAWAYANSATIPNSETGCGVIPLAGAVIEVFNNGSSSNNYTIRITTATTTSVSGALTNAEFIYVFNGTDYSPGWRRVYNTKNKPTASDVGALPLTGGTLSGGLTSSGEIISKYANGFRIAYGSFGFFIRNDGSNTYFMLTASGDTLGSWNGLRPITINNTSGAVSIGNGLNVTGGVNGSLNGNASTATKLQTARNINGVKFDGSGDININTLVSRGRVTALSGSAQGTAGIQMYEAYSNSYPTTYGNVLHMKGASAAGEGELLIGWSGTSGAHAPVFIRSRRDTTDAAWSAWAQVYTAKDSIPGVNTTGNQNTTGNAATATKLQTARKIAGVAFDGSADITLTAANLNAYTKTEVTNLLSSYVKSSALPSMTVRTSSVSGGDMGMSLSTFISHLKSNGAFSKSYWIGFGDAMGFNAGSINNITGFGAVELAESIIEVFNLPNGDYTIRLTTSHKADYGGVTNAILVYHYRSNRSPSGQWLKFAGTVGATSN
ncbi:prophage tail fiber N-terminal domain-containing protein [Escherichia coli]|nr:prophage tail fiber N-terminal domain-containing protein [Escherichia coli]